jgi:hypothetical protein
MNIVQGSTSTIKVEEINHKRRDNPGDKTGEASTMGVNTPEAKTRPIKSSGENGFDKLSALNKT